MKPSRLLIPAVLTAFMLALPWLGWFPAWILLIALVPLLTIEDELSRQKHENPYLFFNFALASFWLWHLLTVWWVVRITIVGTLLLTLLNASSMALIWWIFHRMKRRFNPLFAYIGLCSMWLAFEYFQFHRNIEWPWLNLGNGLASQHRLIQWYEITGTLGGTLWVLISNILVFSIYKKLRNEGFRASRHRIAVWGLLVLLPIGWSLWRYFTYTETGREIEVAVVQPNFDPFTDKFSGVSPAEQYLRIVQLCDSVAGPETDYVVGPETCLPPLQEDEALADNSFVHPFRERSRNYGNRCYVLGAITRKDFPQHTTQPAAGRWDEARKNWFELYNSAIQIDSSGIQRYHKSILVAGVEKIPYEKYFGFLRFDLGGTSGSLGRQSTPNLLQSTQVSVAPVICFESVFGEYVGQFVRKGANVLFVITNDGWLTCPAGYRQHLDLARLRAIETRRSIARSANTGISAFINQRGDVLSKTNWDESTAIKNTLRTNQKQTFYTVFGDYIGRVSSFVGILLLLYFVGQSRLRKRA